MSGNQLYDNNSFRSRMDLKIQLITPTKPISAGPA